MSDFAMPTIVLVVGIVGVFLLFWGWNKEDL